MSAVNIFGGIMLAVPFVVTATLIAHQLGWQETLLIFGGAFAFAGVIVLGVWMVTR